MNTVQCCNNCNGTKVKTVKKLIYKSTRLNLVQCRDCALVFLSPRFSDEFYKKIYHYNCLKNAQYYEKTFLEDKECFLKRLNFAMKYKDNIENVLDIGCATGSFLKVCQEINIKKIHGVELNEESRKISEKKGFKIFADISDTEDKYDLINLGDVIEHFLNPQEELRKIGHFLRNTGVIMITTPDYSKIINKYVNIKPEEHLFYYNKKTIKDLLQRLGYNILFIGNVSRFHIIEHYFYSSTFKIPLIQKTIKTILWFKFDKAIERLVLKRLKSELLVIAEKNGLSA
jgi:2-polyprenyl-3-methyl-5-hydroxy-6-metoxy-1,4-benzoquinol methylase